VPDEKKLVIACKGAFCYTVLGNKENVGEDENMQVGCRTDRGLERPTNEDAYLALLSYPWKLFVVADGMGGHAAGEVASSMAVEKLAEGIRNAAEQNSLPLTATEASDFLISLLQQVNLFVWEKGQQIPLKGMGTTLTAVMTKGRVGLVGHIGDSRAYLIRGGCIHRISQDHSLVEKMVKDGELAESEADSHPQKHILTRALGTQAQAEFDLYPLSIKEGDYLLLCSDGLTNLLTPEEILQTVLSCRQPQRAVDSLVEMANSRGGLDNITAVLVLYDGGDELD